MGIEHRHSGEVECMAYNPLNPQATQRSCYTDLVVLPRPIQLYNLDDFEIEPPILLSSTTIPAPGTGAAAATRSLTTKTYKQIADVPAYVIRGPEDCTALIGGTVCLTVTYGGCPKPSVKWLRAVSIFLFF